MIVETLRSAYAANTNSMTRHEAIAVVIENAIADGSMASGARLPTVRTLSTELGVSASTVVAAYSLLRTRGYIAGEVGRGTFVLGPPKSAVTSQPPLSSSEWLMSSIQHRPPWRRRMVLTSANRLLALFPKALDCTRGKPDTSMILADVVSRAMEAASRDVRAGDLQYASPAPIPELREALLPRLERDCIPANNVEMIVGSSAQQLMVMSLSIAARLMPNRPRLVAVEEPGYQTVFDAFEYLGFRLVGMETDEQGVVPSGLDNALKSGAIAALFTPRALNPKGVSWTHERRVALAEVLNAHPHVIAIEDDQFADLARTSSGSLLDGSAGSRVIYIRTFAKSIAPDLRVAIALSRSQLASTLGEAKALLDGWTSHLAQRSLAYTLSDKALDGALDNVRNSYQRRRETIINVLRTELAATGTMITGTDGLNLWIQLPFGTAATDVVDRAAEAGVLLISGEPFYIQPGHNDVIRMSISGISDSQAELAARRVVEAIRSSSRAASFTIPV